jgi:hypothetical protein
MVNTTTSIRTNEASGIGQAWAKAPGRTCSSVRWQAQPPPPNGGWRVLTHSAVVSAAPAAGLEWAEVENALLFGFGLLLLLLATLLRQWAAKAQSH